MVVFSCKTCDHSISQAFNGAAARGEAHLARIPDPFEAPRAKTIGSTTNIAIGEAHLALFVMWCPGGARSMFRTVSEIRAHKGRRGGRWAGHATGGRGEVGVGDVRRAVAQAMRDAGCLNRRSLGVSDVYPRS